MLASPAHCVSALKRSAKKPAWPIRLFAPKKCWKKVITDKLENDSLNIRKKIQIFEIFVGQKINDSMRDPPPFETMHHTNFQNRSRTQADCLQLQGKAVSKTTGISCEKTAIFLEYTSQGEN